MPPDQSGDRGQEEVGIDQRWLLRLGRQSAMLQPGLDPAQCGSQPARAVIAEQIPALGSAEPLVHLAGNPDLIWLQAGRAPVPRTVCLGIRPATPRDRLITPRSRPAPPHSTPFPR